MPECTTCARAPYNKDSYVCQKCFDYTPLGKPIYKNWVRALPTNADRIRGMSDEELSSEMLFFRPSDSVFIGTAHEECCHYHGLDGSFYRTAEQAVKANMDWLRQPAEEAGDTP